jgi:hypothetical protein
MFTNVYSKVYFVKQMRHKYQLERNSSNFSCHKIFPTLNGTRVIKCKLSLLFK